MPLKSSTEPLAEMEVMGVFAPFVPGADDPFSEGAPDLLDALFFAACNVHGISTPLHTLASHAKSPSLPIVSALMLRCAYNELACDKFNGTLPAHLMGPALRRCQLYRDEPACPPSDVLNNVKIFATMKSTKSFSLFL